MELEKEWVVQIDNYLKSNDYESSSTMEKQKWRKHCIYKIPSCIIEMNKRAYKPQTVSFGPYHHGKENVMGMEEHKQRALVHFLKRCGKPLESLFQSMSEVEQDLRDSYDKQLFVWKEGNHHGKFSKMMILDGCFMLEVLRIGDCRVDYFADYADNDPIFSDHGRLYVMPYIKRDMLMLENQLPMIVLDKLIEFEGRNTRDEEFLNKLILQFFFPGTPPSRSFGKCLHTLDLYRKALLQHSPSHHTVIPKPTKADKHRGYDDDIIIRSVVELRESGIRFKLSDTPSLKDISFNNGILRLPSIIIDDYTESMFLNLMAFERLHVGAGNEVTSYIFFMDNIIDHDVDVAILHRKGIIVNALGSDKDVAKLFNTLARDVSVDRNNGGLDMVQMSVCRYCRRSWNRWRANLIQTYFRNPWAIISLVAAFFLFLFTIVQTVFTIVQFYQPGDDKSTPMSIPRLPPHRP
ncbi:UPF0481 protein [Senna tora]|uniref:UPF0481 protein n=1 Tax=Senna tora TaxID=362788 RepID=A0A834W9J6_9FABA|nr:UPF0481 protein [Senna tora]